jgi:hypothetical protein
MTGGEVLLYFGHLKLVIGHSKSNYDFSLSKRRIQCQ